MTEPWQFRQDLIRTNQAAFARDARHAAQLAELRARRRPSRRLRLPAALLRFIPRRRRRAEVAPA